MNDLFENIDGIAGRIEPSFLERHWIYIAAALMIAATLAAYLLLRKKTCAPISAYELAMMRLRSAEDEPDSKRYVSFVSSAVRDYIGAAFGIPAPERTTEEFMRLARENENIAESERAKIEEILTLSDMVKFAKASFGANERERAMKLALSFINDDEARRKTEAAKK